MKNTPLLVLGLCCFYALKAQQLDTFYQPYAGDSLMIITEEVVVSENRLQIPFSDASRSITIIDREQLDIINPQSVNEALQYVGGLDIRQRGVHGVQADLSIRGGTFEQALVLINGIKMLDPQTGHHMLNLPITVEDIERIGRYRSR